MSRYYIYLERERTRIYRKEDLGKPMSFTIDGKTINEIYNTIVMDYDNDTIQIDPFVHSYEPNHINVCEGFSVLAGVEIQFYQKLEVLLVYIFNLLQERNQEYVLILSNSFMISTIQYMSHIGYRYIDLAKVLENGLNSISDEKMHIVGCVFVEHLVVGLNDLLRNESTDDILYIDDKVGVVTIKYKKNQFESTSLSYGKKTLFKGLKKFDDFNKYLKDEELNMNFEAMNNLRSHILHLMKKGENVDRVTIERRDERKEISCDILKTYRKNEFKGCFDGIKSLLDLHNKDKNLMIIMNVNNEELKEKIKKKLKNTNYYEWSKYNKYDFFYKLLCFSDYVLKYSNIFTLKKLKESCTKCGNDYNQFVFENYIFSLCHCLKQNEIDKICKELKLNRVSII